jgi:uncharacterized protein (DUF1778 family)
MRDSTAPSRTRTPWHLTSLRLPRKVHDLLFVAATRADETRADFIRIAITERAARVLAPESPPQ